MRLDLGALNLKSGAFSARRLESLRGPLAPARMAALAAGLRACAAAEAGASDGELGALRTVFGALGLGASAAGVATVAGGLVTRTPSLGVRSRTWAWILAVAAVGQVVVMERALITRDFTVAFVAEHGSHRTPALFNVATLWSALEGSILLWLPS